MSREAVLMSAIGDEGSADPVQMFAALKARAEASVVFAAELCRQRGAAEHR